MENNTEINENLATIQEQTLYLNRKDIGDNEVPQNAQLCEEQSQEKVDESIRPKNSKFKNFESLETAYEQLEAEFTKKSQELATLKKDQTTDKVQNSTPAYLEKDWTQKVERFFSENEFAQKFKKEIFEEIVGDEKIKNHSQPLTQALLKVVSSKVVDVDGLAKDENFLSKNIYSNPAIREKIVNDYLGEIKSKQTPPMIASTFASSLASAQTAKPKSLKEVKELVKKMFV